MYIEVRVQFIVVFFVIFFWGGGEFLSGVKKCVLVISECGLHMVSEILAESLRVFY